MIVVMKYVPLCKRKSFIKMMPFCVEYNLVHTSLMCLYVSSNAWNKSVKEMHFLNSNYCMRNIRVKYIFITLRCTSIFMR